MQTLSDSNKQHNELHNHINFGVAGIDSLNFYAGDHFGALKYFMRAGSSPSRSSLALTYSSLNADMLGWRNNPKRD